MAIKGNLTKPAISSTLWCSPLAITLAVIATYSILGLIAYWPTLPWSSTRLPTCACGDPVQSVWFLRWLPFAIAHGHNPFYTTWLNYPVGANLAQNTLMPLLGMLAAPISVLYSPIASFNFLAWLAFPASAFSMFYVMRYFTRSNLAAFIAGLLYGFSPYMIGQASSHMMLSFIPLPPLIVMTCWKLFVKQKHNPWLMGIMLGIEAILQFFIEPEVLALTALAVLFGLLALALLYIKSLTVSQLKYALKGLTASVIITCSLLAYPIWYMVSGPNHFIGSNFPKNNPYRSDLIGAVVPTLNQKLVPSQFYKIASSTAGGDFQEIGDYVGLPLLLILLVGVIRFRRNYWIVICTGLAFSFWILSLGPELVMNGSKTAIKLPFEAILNLPLLGNILPSRFSLIEWLFLSVSIGHLVREWQSKRKAVRQRRNRWLSGLVFSVLVLAVLLTLMPRWPYHSQSINVPKLLMGRGKIVANSVALTYPYPIFPENQAMLWQSENGMNFKLVGGYIQNRNTRGIESEFPALLDPPSVQGWLANKQGALNVPWPLVRTLSSGEVRSFVLKNNVDLIIVNKNEPNSRSVTDLLKNAFGQPKAYNNVFVWTGVQHKL